ncbi:MAG: RodZ domain-containing protein [Pseudomonadota bacterium]
MGRGQGQSGGREIPYAEYETLDVPLGDLLRGERATLGKSLLDVERDLKIKATYIAAIENADLDAFASRGFIAGYVRSYARYLGLDPEWTYERFSRESGFRGTHGISAKQAEAAKRRFAEAPGRVDPNDVISAARVSFAPEKERLFDRIEPGALGSILVLVAIVLGIGYGAWAILYDIQRLQFAPVDEAPSTLAELDPATDADRFAAPDIEASGAVRPADDRVDRLYRPQALDVPVLTPRDEPLSTLDPDQVGTLAVPEIVEPEEPELAAAVETPDVQVTARVEETVVLVAVCPAWVRLTSATGAVLYEGTLDAGQQYPLPQTTDAASLRTGNAGGIYFLVDGELVGPAGNRGEITDNIALSSVALADSFPVADLDAAPEEVEYVQLVLAGVTPDVMPGSCQ